MGSRVPMGHYDLRSAANSFIGTTLHDLNSGDDVTDDNDDRSSAVVTDCMDGTYRSALALHSIGVEDDRSSLENNGSSSGPYTLMTIDDVSPIESARARLLDVIVDHFIDPHVIEMSDYEADYLMQPCSQDKASKRKSREIRYEGDARYALPLMYVANLYETLVNEANMRLSSTNGMREKTIGVALEAAGGLYRKLAKKFPRKGSFIFKRRELATSFETRSRFPELVIQEEKRVRFVVVNGLAIVEKPTKIGIEDAEWFKRLTGRSEVAVSATDYKFYAPRHKYRRAMSNSISNITGLPSFPSPENSSPMATSQGYRPSNEDFIMAEKDNLPELELKRKSGDIVWDYGVLYNKDKRDWITCKLCKRLIKGGVYRMKLHIAGIVGQVEACHKASDEDKKRVRAYIENNKNKKRERMEELKEEKTEVNIGVDEDDCQAVRDSSKKRSEHLGLIDPIKARQQNINDALKLKFTNDVHEYVARWIYEAGISFHAIDNQSFRQLVEAIGQFGPGYKPPSQYLLREPFLKQQVEKTKVSLQKNEEEWKKNGCSIMTDAWTDRKRRCIMNLCVNCKLGTSFFGSIEESMEAHTGVYIFEFVEKCINEIGSQHVVQVVTDNATNNMVAADLLKIKQPQIFWTSCATHTINLMLEAIGKLPKFSGVIGKAKALTIFIYAHHRTLAIMRKYTKKMDIVRPGVTRFATSFLTLESLKDKKDQLRLMFTSEEWSQTKLRSSVKGKAAEATVTSISFWNGVSLALNILIPLVKVLRLVDGDKNPSMAFLLGALKQAKEEIRKSFKNEENATHILKIIDEKSKGRLDSPLHYASYMLNPFFYFKNPSVHNDTNIMNEFLNCVEIIFPTDEDMQSTIANDELLKYKNKTGNFGRKMAVAAYEKVDVYHEFDPVGWWSNYGGDTPNLQRMATRFLSLTSSSSGCERNWSQSEGIHTKKRNRLETSRLNDLVYVKFNVNLMKKKSKREMGGDMLLSSQASEAQGWLVDGGDDDEVELGSGLTWRIITEASGADEVLQPRRSIKNIPVNRELDDDLDTSEEENEENVDFESDDERIMNVIDSAYVDDLED